jgi:hypothetical protein
MKQRSSSVRAFPRPLPRRIIQDGWWLQAEMALPGGVVLPFERVPSGPVERTSANDGAS